MNLSHKSWSELEAAEKAIVDLVARAGWVPKLAPSGEHLERSTIVAQAIEAARERSDDQLPPRLRERIAARERLIREIVVANMRLVSYFSHRYKGRYEHDDLIQEGCLGLLRAVQKFEHWRGIRFSTYASPWIRQAMQRAIAQKAPVVRMPVYQQERRRSLGRATERYRTRFGRAPTHAELADELAWPLEDVLGTPAPDISPLSIDTNGGWTEGVAIIKQLPGGPEDSPEGTLDAKAEAIMVRRAVKGLGARDRAIITSRYGIDGREATLAEIGAEVGLSRERVRQLECAALERLSRRLPRRVP